MSNQEPNIEGWLPDERMPRLKGAYNVYPLAERFIPRVMAEQSPEVQAANLELARKIMEERRLYKEYEAKRKAELDLRKSIEDEMRVLLSRATYYMDLFDAGNWNKDDATNLSQIDEETYSKILICLRYPKDVALQLLSQAHLGADSDATH